MLSANYKEGDIMYSYYGYNSTLEKKEALNVYVAKVFGWMFLGLSLTALTALYVASSEMVLNAVFSNRLLFYGLMIGEVLLVMYLSGWISKIRPSTAVFIFLLYSVLNGVNLSVIFLAFTAGSIAYAFFITAITFGIMSVYGYATRNDLTRTGNLLFMGLVGFVILSVVNMFIASSSLEWIMSILGLFAFLGLTAYDTQGIKQLYYETGGYYDLHKKVSILGALRLYLDLINIFLILLRLFARKK